MREPDDEKENQSDFLNIFIYLHIVTLDQRHYTKPAVNNKHKFLYDFRRSGKTRCQTCKIKFK